MSNVGYRPNGVRRNTGYNSCSQESPSEHQQTPAFLVYLGIQMNYTMAEELFDVLAEHQKSNHMSNHMLALVRKLENYLVDQSSPSDE